MVEKEEEPTPAVEEKTDDNEDENKLATVDEGNDEQGNEGNGENKDEAETAAEEGDGDEENKENPTFIEKVVDLVEPEEATE